MNSFSVWFKNKEVNLLRQDFGALHFLCDGVKTKNVVQFITVLLMLIYFFFARRIQTLARCHYSDDHC